MKDGGPAFPSKKTDNDQKWLDKGMTLRDYFAAKALQGLLAHFGTALDKYDAAEGSYNYADAILKARES